MKKIILAVIVVVVASVAGVYFYINYKVKQSVDKVIAAAQPVARITYQDIGNNMDGSLMVKGISIAGNRGFDASVDSVELVLPSLTDLMNMTDTFKSNKLLPAVHLKINHLRMDMSIIPGILKSMKYGEDSFVNRMRWMF